MPTTDEPRTKIVLTNMADNLDQLQSTENDGRGVSCVRMLARELRRFNLTNAKAIAHNEYDKIRNYPEIKEVVDDLLFLTFNDFVKEG